MPGRPAAGGPDGGRPDRTGSTQQDPPKADLSLNKVLAGAGAAATTAVLGSFFGAEGTVVGAAFGSVASTLATTLYQRSLDRTRDTLVARVRVRRTGTGGAGGTGGAADPSDSEMTVRLPPIGPDGSVEPDLGEQPPARRRWLLWAGLTALAFAIAMAVITGIELAKGSTITGNDSGTSIGRAVEPKAATPAEEEQPDSTTETDTTTTPEPTEDPDASTTLDPDAPGNTEGNSDTQQDEEQAPEDDPGGAVDIAPTEQDEPGDAPTTPGPGSRSGAGSGTGGGSGISNQFGSGIGDRFGAGATPTTQVAPTTTTAAP